MADQLAPVVDAKSDSGGVRAVNRALDLLIALACWDRPAGLTELARRVELHPSTALRLLDSLRSRRFVHQTANGTYVLGAKNFELGNAYLQNVSVWSQANQLAEQLAITTGETASVGVLDSGQILYIAIARGQQDMGIASAPGTRHPAYCTSLGKAILADLSGEKVLEVLRNDPPERLTPQTLTNIAELQRDLATTRRRGYSIDNEERTPGVVCIGAAIRDHKGDPLGALSISGPAQRIRQKGVEQLGRVVSETAMSFST
ncbi:IclR family transcriptional regulator [Mycolicibacterium agri]|nr:IclR family transcriptional regulator [Mycolicibacterium agri]GFG50091.1 IclR family transcriptional regulator [Mycolicibacterium agri]